MSKIVKFLEKIWASIKDLFDGLVPELKEAVAFGVEAVEAFKQYVDSPLADAITAFIPGSWDDAAKDWLRAVLPGILQQLKLAEASLEHPDEIIAAAARAYSQLQDEDMQKLALHNMSILIARKRSDDRITIGQAVAMQEYYYRNELPKESVVK